MNRFKYYPLSVPTDKICSNWENHKVNCNRRSWI